MVRSLPGVGPGVKEFLSDRGDPGLLVVGDIGRYGGVVVAHTNNGVREMTKEDKELCKKLLTDFIDEAERLEFNIINEPMEVPDRFFSHYEPSGWKEVTLRAFSAAWMSKRTSKE